MRSLCLRTAISVALLLLIASSAALPPDFQLDEVTVRGSTFNPADGLILMGYSLAADPVDELHFITGSVPSSVPQLSQAVYVYAASTSIANDWTRQITFTAPTGFTNRYDFGSSVDIYGQFAVVGAPSATNPIDYPGVVGFAFIYQKIGPTWTNRAPYKVIPNPTTDSCRFGRGVSIWGTQVLVACAAASPRLSSTATGAAYLFDTEGTQIDVHTPMIQNDTVGGSVALSETLVAFNVLNWNSSSVEIVDRAGGAKHYITGDDMRFGQSIATENVTILIGARNRALMYEYSDSENDFELQYTFMDPVLPTTSTFGFSVALLGPRVLVGAPVSNGRSTATGSSTVFYQENGVWGSGITVGATDGKAADQFGYAVALTTTNVLVGSFGATCDTCIALVPGAVYSYNQSNSCGLSPIPNTPTVCSPPPVRRMYFFNPNLRIDLPAVIIAPIVIVGNLSVAANITVYTNASGAPLTTVGCLALENGTLKIVLDEGAEDVVIANTRCVTGKWDTVELQPDPSDCRKYKVAGQSLDKAAGTFSVLLSVNRHDCDAAKRRNIIIGSVIGGVAFLAVLTLIGLFLAYKMRASFMDRLFKARNEDPETLHI